MFKTFRNFPRKKDPANTIPQETINTFVIDGINDTSGGVWISPTRNTTTDDGTLHIGLMNPFGAALTTIIQSAANCVPFEGGQASIPCQAVCTSCDCNSFAAALNAELDPETPPNERWFATCKFTQNDPNCPENCICQIECLASRTTGGPFGGEIFSAGPCPTGVANFDCSPSNTDPPDQVSQIIRAIERFILDLDITQIENIDPNTITSAILRLPIKSKRDWM